MMATATLVINIATLGAVLWYAAEASRAANAAGQEAEPGYSAGRVMIGKAQEGLRAAAQSAWREVAEGQPAARATYTEEIADGDPTFVNIGSGPALRVLVRNEKLGDAGWTQHAPAGEVGYVAKG